jgi:hypothetical protein
LVHHRPFLFILTRSLVLFELVLQILPWFLLQRPLHPLQYLPRLFQASDLGFNAQAFQFDRLLLLLHLAPEISDTACGGCLFNAFEETCLQITRECFNLGFFTAETLNLSRNLRHFFGHEWSQVLLALLALFADKSLYEWLYSGDLLADFHRHFFWLFLSAFLLGKCSASRVDLLLQLFKLQLPLLQFALKVCFDLCTLLEMVLFNLMGFVLQFSAFCSGLMEGLLKLFFHSALLRNSLLRQLHFFQHPLLYTAVRVEQGPFFLDGLELGLKLRIELCFVGA